MRVYEFSKLYNVSTRDILESLKKTDLKVASHMSILGDEAIAFLKNALKVDVKQSAVLGGSKETSKIHGKDKSNKVALEASPQISPYHVENKSEKIKKQRPVG